MGDEIKLPFNSSFELSMNESNVRDGEAREDYINAWHKV